MSALSEAIQNFLDAVVTRIQATPSDQVLVTPRVTDPALSFFAGLPFLEINVATTLDEFNTFHGANAGHFIDARSDMVYYSYSGSAWQTNIYSAQPWSLKPQMAIWSPGTEMLYYLDENTTLVEVDNTPDA